MSPFVAVGLYSACIAAVGSFTFLLALSYLGTGFNFDNIMKDLSKIAFVSSLVGLAEAAWLLGAIHHWSFHLIIMLVHGILLRVVFFEDLSKKEASMVAVASRVLYFLVALVLMALPQSSA